MKLIENELTAREQKIELLLTWYMDVLEGWQEMGRGADGMGVKLMGRAWNHPTYQELQRCLIRLRDEENATYWHVRETFQAARRTVLACPRCFAVSEVAAKHFDANGAVKIRHKHPDVVFFVRKTVPAVNAAVRPEVVRDGIRWIASAFAGEPFVPDELLAKERAA